VPPAAIARRGAPATPTTTKVGPTPIASPLSTTTGPSIRAPLTRVPLRLPRSSTTIRPSRSTIRVCERDTRSSSIITVDARDRPNVTSTSSASSITRLRASSRYTTRNARPGASVWSPAAVWAAVPWSVGNVIAYEPCTVGHAASS